VALDDLHLLFERLHPRPDLRQVEAVELVLALPPAGTDPDFHAAAGDMVRGHRRLRQHRRVAEGRR
jgi:hypothetical protein